MRYKDVIYLISVNIVEDELGNQIEMPKERKVYANQFKVNSSVVSMAKSFGIPIEGMKHSKLFEIYSFEYNDEDRLKYNDIVYRIIGVSFQGEKTRISCEKDVG